MKPAQQPRRPCFASTARKLLPVVVLSAWNLCVAAPQVFSLPAAESSSDVRAAYPMKALKLALEKTRAKYGDFDARFASVPMNTARLHVEVKSATYPNLMLLDTFQNEMLDEGFDYARFPLDLGVTGYRICFVSPKAKEAVSRVETLDELKRFTIGQGSGWADVKILRHNGFKVIEVSGYENMFRMVAAGRFDLFCRGVDELEAELAAHPNLAGLDYDRSFAISYPLPRFLISGKQNAPALARVTKGLKTAYQDGSLQKLWLAQYQSSLQFANLKQRRIFNLQTPDIGRIDFNYRQYYFDPRK